MNTTFSTSKTLFFLLFFISTAAIFHSCVKEQQFLHNPLTPINGNTYTPNSQDEIITTSILGLILDENDTPIAGSEVLLRTINGLKSVRTNANGNFLYRNVMVLRNSTVLKIFEPGKFKAFRKMILTPNSYNYTEIKLLDRTVTGTIPGLEGGFLQDVSSPAKIELSPYSMQQEDGESYIGDINVLMSWIDPTAEDLASKMIGDLSGIDADGKQVALGTFGMLNVELRGENWEKLQPKEGWPAKLYFPVPNEILEQAPLTIPLWSFDETLGIWEEEGLAVLQDGFYVGEVAHFSSWNVDTKTDPISVTGKVFIRADEEDREASYLKVYVDIEGVQQVGGYLDSSGEFEFYNFPANTTFTLTILDTCGDIVWEEELGPYAENTDLGTIVIQPTSNNFVTISGSGVDCVGNPIEGGYLKLNLNNSYFLYPLKEDGSFEFVFNACNETEGDVYLIDLPNEKISSPQTIDFSTQSIALNSLIACDELHGFIKIRLDGEDWGYFIDTEAGQSRITGIDYNLNKFVQLSWEQAVGVGIYEDMDIYVSYLNSSGGDFLGGYFEKITIEFTEFGENPGDIIKGTLSSDEEIFISDQATNSLTGSFKVIRQ